MNTAYIALGSNLGDRFKNLGTALKLLSKTDQIKIASLSAVYETAPVGGPEQGPYLNACAAIITKFSPTQLLLVMLNIEEQMGRVREAHWGPRLIDLDQLLYEEIVINTPLLELPHPRLGERDFVLIPLADIAPDLIIPRLNQSVSAILSARQQTEDVKLFLPQGWYELS